jgi:hypothetical protein
MTERRTYYIEVASGEITQSQSNSPWNFKIEANDAEIHTLRSYFDENEQAELGNFLRAQIPFKEYHLDKENDIQDEKLKHIYQLIYHLGDQEAKQHIESMGILDEVK